MRDFPAHYILVGHTPVAVDLRTWEKAFEERHKAKVDPWRVGLTVIDDECHVSTLFIGLNHNYFSVHGDPLLFETMIFGGPLHGGSDRYYTWAEAERGHREAVTKAQIACAQVKAIADKAGVK